jgi:hypothetical protein
MSLTKKELIRHGYDGLCTTSCGCSINDLAPCGEIISKLKCKPAYSAPTNCYWCDIKNECDCDSFENAGQRDSVCFFSNKKITEKLKKHS